MADDSIDQLDRSAGGNADPYHDFFDYDDETFGRDFVRVPHRNRWLRRIALGSVLFVVVAIIALGLVALWALRQFDPPGGPGEPVNLVVADGSSVEQIADQLADSHVITNSLVFQSYVRLVSGGPYQAGEYEFAERSSVKDAVAVLDAGPRPPDYFDVTVPPGFRLTAIVDRLATDVERFDRSRLQVLVDGGTIRSAYQPAEVTNLEGLLFPDTYRVDENETESEVLERLVSQMDQELTALDVTASAEALGYTPYQLVIIASMIEREARLPEDQAKISRVIHNRLARGEPLGIDATLLYAIGDERRELTVEDLEMDSPYNTRKVRGLPPTPIASPGRGALDAAIHPAEGDWLWYVLATEEGGHFFTNDFDEFNAAKIEAKAKGLF